MDIVNIIQSQLSDQLLDGLGQQVGLSNRTQTKDATMTAVTALLGALSKNASSSQGLNALSGALDKDHDGSILDDLTGLLLNQRQPTAQQSRTMNGAGILKHVLGGKQDGIVDVISQVGGMDKNGSLQLLMKVAPMVMGVLGQQKKQQSMSNNVLGDLLKTASQQSRQQTKQVSLLTQILDQDGDGSIADEAASFGLKFLGNLFKKKR
jgi:hypothetical protein